jgi:hypothetical protein
LCIFKKKPKQKIWTQNCNSFPDLPATSARLANEYCPASHPAQYLLGQEPKLTCLIHEKPEPEPPVIPQCKIPYCETKRLVCFTGSMLCTLSTQDLATFKESDLPDYFSFLVEHGVNSFRSFSSFFDEGDGWNSWRPDRDADYYEHLHKRLTWATERKLTVILSLWPYKGTYSDAVLIKLIEETWPRYEKYIIYEPINENGNLSDQVRIVNMLLSRGVTNKYTQLYFEDSGAWAQYLVDHPGMISTQHEVGSMATVDKWWEGSPGCHELMDKVGFYGGDDGGDKEKDSHGLMFFGNPDSKRPDNGQLYEICKFMFEHSVGFDHLSASGFQHGNVPNLADEMAIGKDEMDHMAQAYLDSKLP